MIHTIPSRNQTKSVLIAPDAGQLPGVDEPMMLVYTDISSLELRGISAISGDPVMNKFFKDGLDIVLLCPSQVIVMIKLF